MLSVLVAKPVSAGGNPYVVCVCSSTPTDARPQWNDKQTETSFLFSPSYIKAHEAKKRAHSVLNYFQLKLFLSLSSPKHGSVAQPVFEACLNERTLFSHIQTAFHQACLIIPRRRLRRECLKWPETNVGLPHPADLQHSSPSFFFSSFNSQSHPALLSVFLTHNLLFCFCLWD